MALSEKHLKILWGKAAGYCSKPGCQQDLILFLVESGDTVLGEMAHVIPQSPDGPRGDGGKSGEDTYENTILLCPTHHRLIDKAPSDFPAETLFAWKRKHEEARHRMSGPAFFDLRGLAVHIDKLLEENHSIWMSYGPESELAIKNPFSNGALIWKLRKVSTIVPNNEKIIRTIQRHKNFFTTEAYRTCVEFIEHAKAFEMSSYDRLDREVVPRFPTEFRKLIAELLK